MSVPGASIVQPRLIIPLAVDAGLASGELFRAGGVVRRVADGTIHTLLKEAPASVTVAREVAKRAASSRSKMMVPVVLAALVVGAVGAGAASVVRKRRNAEGPHVATEVAVELPECVSNFEASLHAYVDAARDGALAAVTVDRLIADLDEVSAWVDGGNAVEFSFTELEPVFSVVIGHTAALARVYSVVPAALEHQNADRDAGMVVHLRQHLEAQKQILDEAALAVVAREPGLPAGRRSPHSTGDADLELLLQHIARTLGPSLEWLEPDGYPDSLGLCVLDAIWSIGVRYGGVQNVVARYRELRRATGADPTSDSVADVRQAIAAVGGPEAFADAVHNRQLTSTRNGVLKAAAVDEACAALLTVSITTTTDLRSADPRSREAAKTAWCAVPGQGSGISWRYLLLLSGDQEVKPDRMIVGFVGEALGRTPTPDAAANAITAAAAHLGVPLRALDHAAWRHQSGRT